MKNQSAPKPRHARVAITLLAFSVMTVAALDTATTPTATAAGAANPTAPALSFGVPDVLKLSNAKVSDDTIVSYIEYSGRSYGALSAAEIVYLHEQGVSGRVVTAMLEQRKKWAPAAAPAPQPAPAASAPQYQPAPAPAPVTYVQPAPASTVHVIPYTPRYVDYRDAPAYRYYGYGYPYSGYYSYGYPAVSLSFGYYGGYRGGDYCGTGYRGGAFYGGGYYGGGHYGGGHHSGGSRGGGGRHR